MSQTIQELANEIINSIYEEDRNIRMREVGYVQRTTASEFIKNLRCEND